VFRALPRAFRPGRAEGVEEAIEFRIRDGQGGVDLWTAHIAEGRCRMRRGAMERPRVKLEMATGDFLALCTGHANGAALLFEGRISVDGDLLFAGEVATMFRAPRPR
jgi:hypothetical protein